ncbi:hypothetical protein BJY04DRAFT_187086 [Aspergillus karnatakaensis]|uniref:uncharacterized protein n=1 Tax=Aspergillus karnatakaensis TaxID=1810916 RepID=UPI003CCDE18B
METDRAAAIFDAFAAIYDSRGNVIDGERYSDRAYNIYAQISGIGSKEAITSGLRVDRLRRELGQLMDRMKKEHRLETKEEAFTRELEVDIAQKIEEQGKPDPQLLCNLAELYRKRFDDSGKWSCLETAIKWLGTAIELLDCDAPNSGAWKKALCDYQLQASPRI